MKVISHGNNDITRRQSIVCTNCRACLEFTKMDIEEHYPDLRSTDGYGGFTFGLAILGRRIEIVQCPECGHSIEVTE
jgi:Zn ribbon nucleic-acid-binding protein